MLNENLNVLQMVELARGGRRSGRVVQAVDTRGGVAQSISRAGLLATIVGRTQNVVEWVRIDDPIDLTVDVDNRMKSSRSIVDDESSMVNVAAH